LGIVLILGLVGWVGWSYQQAAERDTQRVADLHTIQAQAVAAKVPAMLAEGAPAPVQPNHPYIYTARDGNFVACTTFERRDAGRALFVTASGSVRDAKRFCQPAVDPRGATIVTEAKLTDAAIPTFLGANPEMADAATVKAKCQTAGADEVLFGCYLPENKIWILRVSDPSLAGLDTVAAVHELLHALESSDRPSDELLEQGAASVNDSQLTEELTPYSKEERSSEIDARLGTEYANLPGELETYYRKYFDRAAVVARYQTYGQLVREINTLQQRIETERAQLDQLKAAGEISAYNERVDDYNAQVRRYNVLAAKYNLVGE
jgi:hypothetical protein